MPEVAKILITVGMLLILVGLGMWLGAKFNIKLFHLPGDITWKGKNFTFYFPFTTGIILSVLLSLLLWFFQRFN